jgi:cytochrome P450
MSTFADSWQTVRDTIGFRADSTGFLLRLAREQGEVARFRLGGREAVLFAHPDAVTSVLVEKAALFTKGKLMQRARRLLGDGLLTSEGDAHRSRRRRIQPAFARAQVDLYASPMCSIGAEHAARWTSGQQVPLRDEMNALAMNLVARTLFGTNILEEIPQLPNALQTVSRCAPLLALPGGRWLEHSPRIAKSLRIIERAVTRMINDEQTRSPLIGRLLSCPHGGGALSERAVRDEVMTIFLAGHDTTAAAFMWTWLLINQRPRVEAALQRELSDVVGRTGSLPEDPSCLPYTNMVVNEVLRLYPPIGRIGRRPIEDVAIEGVCLTAGTPVFVSPFVTHRDARWFDQPDSFIPERWSHSSERPRFAFFPFGAGPRSCIGEYFARQALVLAIATIAQRFKLSSSAKLPRPRSLLTVKPRGCPHMEVHNR